MKVAIRMSAATCLAAALALALLALTPPAGAEGGNWPPIGTLVSGIPEDVAVQGNYAYVAALGAMTVNDITDPLNPIQVGYCDTPDQAIAIDISGNYAYVADGSDGLRVISVSDPTNPVEVANVQTGCVCQDVQVVDKLVYLASGYSGLVIVDITHPTAPVLLSSLPVPEDGYAYGVAVYDTHAYIAAGAKGLRVDDISNPLAPRETGKATKQKDGKTDLYVYAVAAFDHYAYGASGGSGLRIIDVTSATQPKEVGSWTDDYADNVTVSPKGYAYVTSGGGVSVVDVSDPPVPFSVSTWWPPEVSASYAVAVTPGYAYVADAYAGLWVVDVRDPEPPQEVGFARAPIRWAMGAATYDPYAFVTDGLDGLRIFNIANKSNPVPLSTLNTSGYAENVTVYTGPATDPLYPPVAFVADGNGGMVIVSFADPANPVPLSTYGTPGWCWRVALQATPDLKKMYAYIACNGGLEMLDVTDPVLPVYLGSFATSWPAVDVAVAGEHAYLALGYGGVQIVNVKDPKKPVAEGSLPTHDRTWGIAISGRFSGPYLYTAEGAGGLWVADVSDPLAPASVGHCGTPGYARAVSLTGGYACVADNDKGIRLIDITDPTSPVEETFFDTPGFAGAVAITPGYAYVADDWAGMRIIRIPSPLEPVDMGEYDRPGHAYAVAVRGNYAYVSDSAPGIKIVDVSDRSNPREVSRFAFWYGTDGLVIDGTTLYTCDGDGLRLWDISNPLAPSMLGVCHTPGRVLEVAVSGSYAYAADDWPGVRIIDCSDRHNPILRGYWDTLGWTLDIVAVGTTVYTVDEWAGLRIVDASNPLNPVEIGYWDTPVEATGVDVVGDYAYVADAWGGLRIINVSDPTRPVEVSSIGTSGSAIRVQVVGGYAYVGADTGGLRIIDVSNPRSPVLRYWWDTPGWSRQPLVDGDYVYLADYGWGLMIFNSIPPKPGEINGRVTAAGTGAGIEGATVEARRGATLTGSATTDSNGDYRLASLPPGTYSVTALKNGYVRRTKTGLVLDAGATITANFTLNVSGLIAGQVREMGTTVNIPGATISAYLNGVLQITGTANYRGIYLLPADLPGGEYVVTAVKYGYTQQTKAHISVTVGQTSYVNFQLSPIPIMKGQVKNDSGDPVVGAVVAVYNGSTWVRSTLTQAPYGVYEFGPELPPGTYTVIASKAGYASQAKWNITVAAGSSTYLNFVLAVSGTLKGQVKDLVTGTPIAGAMVSAYSSGVLRATGMTTAPYGVYEISSDLPAGTYYVVASKSGYNNRGRKDITVSSGVTTFVNFGLQPK
jgi:hypothetical protein